MGFGKAHDTSGFLDRLLSLDETGHKNAWLKLWDLDSTQTLERLGTEHTDEGAAPVVISLLDVVEMKQLGTDDTGDSRESVRAERAVAAPETTAETRQRQPVNEVSQQQSVPPAVPDEGEQPEPAPVSEQARASSGAEANPGEPAAGKEARPTSSSTG